MKKLLYVIASALAAAVLTALVLEGYNYSWTGFSEYVPTNKDAVRAKSLWDWLDLLVVPAVLAVAAFLLEGSRKRSEQAVEIDRQRQQTLDAYFDYVSELLLSGHFSALTTSQAARELARTRTLAALRLLDGRRKAQVLQFLYEARLIDSSPVISLNGADLRAALLDEATLSGAEMRGAYFNGASIRFATLSGSDLRGSDFSEADFNSSNLTDARLSQARLFGADLRSATLKGADLSGVDLSKVRMTYEQRCEVEKQT
jgi:Pentapeptide repeats (8 copies)